MADTKTELSGVGIPHGNTAADASDEAGDGRQTPHPRVTYLVKRLELAVRSHLDEVTSHLGLTTPQYAALSVLHMKPGISSAELARMSFVSAQAMNEMVVLLVQKDLIRRESAPAHRKILRIFLTQTGEECLRACEKQVDEVEARMLAQLDPGERGTLARALRMCSDALA